MTGYELWYGRDEPPAEARRLRAGPVGAALDGWDLRHVRIDGIEVVRRLYVAVRDHNWPTIPGAVSGLTVRGGGDRFEVDFDATHRRGDLPFAWQGSIRGEPDGTIRYSKAGPADSAFRYNRIGSCVLHPPETAAGRPFRADTHRGPYAGVLPVAVQPQRMAGDVYVPVFPACERLAIDLAGGVTARFDVAGDPFEMEDQRNWTDASFKTFCTPLWEP